MLVSLFSCHGRKDCEVIRTTQDHIACDRRENLSFSSVWLFSVYHRLWKITGKLLFGDNIEVLKNKTFIGFLKRIAWKEMKLENTWLQMELIKTLQHMWEDRQQKVLTNEKKEAQWVSLAGFQHCPQRPRFQVIYHLICMKSYWMPTLKLTFIMWVFHCQGS